MSAEHYSLVRIVSPYFVAGALFNPDGVCMPPAPILRWCVGKPRAQLLQDFKRRGW